MLDLENVPFDLTLRISRTHWEQALESAGLDAKSHCGNCVIAQAMIDAGFTEPRIGCPFPRAADGWSVSWRGNIRHARRLHGRVAEIANDFDEASGRGWPYVIDQFDIRLFDGAWPGEAP